MRFTDLDQYDYDLPPELIRRVPLEPRDDARLFVYDRATDTIRFDHFRNVANYLPAGAVIVLNDTRVRPARLWLRKPTGGKVEVLVLVNEWDGAGLIPALVDRKIRVGDRLTLSNGDGLIVEHQVEERFLLRLESEQHLFDVLDQCGETPIPHYLEADVKRDESALRQRYQTVFAAAGASVAAPTAALHFTPTVFDALSARGIHHVTMRLDVGPGTFAPLSDTNFQTRKLHQEFVTIPIETTEALNQARADGGKCIAVGTTVARTLETVVREGAVLPFKGPIDTFLYPPHHFQAVDILMTNFHLPKTSLMLLVEAFLRSGDAPRTVTELYRVAIEERFAFYSFGDSMLII